MSDKPMRGKPMHGRPMCGGPMRGNARGKGFADGSFDPVHG
jgi:hypothetical protein